MRIKALSGLLLGVLLATQALAQTTTPNLSLTLPPAAPNTWGAQYNSNFLILDTKFPGGIPSQVIVQDETVDLNARPKINFTGAGVVCSDDAGNNRVNCTIAGSATANQNANTLFAGPTSGAAAAPTFRALVDADIPVTLTGKSLVNMTVGGVATSGRYLRFDGVGGILSRLVYDIGTVAQLPASPQNGQPFIVTDALSSSSCTVGGGSIRIHCGYNSTAAAWQPLGGDTSGLQPLNATLTTISSTGNPILDNSAGGCTDGGASDTYACNLTPALDAYRTFGRYRFKANTANTGAATINFNSLGAKTIKKAIGGVTTDLADNDIRAGQVVDVVYDGTNMQMQSVLGNAAAVVGADTQVIFNDGGSFGASAGLVFAKASGTLTATLLRGGDVSTNSWDLDTSAITGHKAQAVQNVADTFVYRASTDTLTNKTLDCEGTGNVCSAPWPRFYPAAGCNNATAATIWDLPTATPAVPACVTGTNIQKGVLDFADTAGGFSAQITDALPVDWTTGGTIDANIYWTTSAITGNAKWSLSTACTAVNASATDDPAFNTANTVTTAAPGTTNHVQTSTITGLTTTGCTTATKMLLHLKIFRDGNDGADTIAATARLIGIELIFRRAM